MICPPLSPSKLVVNWVERHRNPVSFVLHIIGIPPTILGVLLIPVYVYCLSIPIFLFALAMFVGWLRSPVPRPRVEGTDPGEIIYFKRKLGLSYVDIAPPRRSRRGVA